MTYLITCIRRFKDMGPDFYIIGDQFLFEGTEEETKKKCRMLMKEENYSEIRVTPALKENKNDIQQNINKRTIFKRSK